MKTHDGIETKLENCKLISRHDDKEPYLFYVRENGEILANLKGYAIITIEEYERLKKMEEYNVYLRRDSSPSRLKGHWEQKHIPVMW